MKLLALLTPAAMLGVLWALQRLERWMVRPEATASPPASGTRCLGHGTRAAAAIGGGEPVVAEVGEDASSTPPEGPSRRPPGRSYATRRHHRATSTRSSRATCSNSCRRTMRTA